MKIEFLHRENDHTVHNCHRGNCVRQAKYTVFDQYSVKIENLCVQHAKMLSEKKKIPMPKRK